jgi:hypothetical protein
MENDFEELRLKRDTLEKALRLLREQGQDSPSARNEIIADNECAWEIGLFGAGAQGGRVLTDKELHGLVFRMRRDVLAAKLNTAQILDLLAKAQE